MRAQQPGPVGFPTQLVLADAWPGCIWPIAAVPLFCLQSVGLPNPPFVLGSRLSIPSNSIPFPLHNRQSLRRKMFQLPCPNCPVPVFLPSIPYQCQKWKREPFPFSSIIHQWPSPVKVHGWLEDNCPSIHRYDHSLPLPFPQNKLLKKANSPSGFSAIARGHLVSGQTDPFPFICRPQINGQIPLIPWGGWVCLESEPSDCFPP